MLKVNKFNIKSKKINNITIAFLSDIHYDENFDINLEKQIIECYNVKIGIIVDKFLPSKFISENYYCLDTNDNVAWKESELELID